jgi:excinuclease ABC subunit B
VEYFVSYFDYYQPEAYIPRSDTYIEKDSSINEEIERLRLSTMGSLLTREDVLVVASVSCIYGLGSPEDYEGMMVTTKTGDRMDRDAYLEKIVSIMYERNDIDFGRGQFRVRGDVVEVFPAYLENEAIRVEFFGDEIERVSVINPLTGNVTGRLEGYTLYPAKQFVTPADKMNRAMIQIREEMTQRVAELEQQGKLLEAQRIKMRTEYDLEMMREMGFCQGIENYSRHLAQREPGQKPGTLLDFFGDDYLVMVDESHVSIPQIGGMYEGDHSRKKVLVEHGFRLPSALDNRPLRIAEYMESVPRLLYVSATPGRFEMQNSFVGNTTWKPVQPRSEDALNPLPLVKASGSAESPELFDVHTPGKPLVVEQIIRPTGLLDPVIEIRPLTGQIDETIGLCRETVAKGQRILVVTLTKRTAEELSDYLRNLDFRVRYLHSDIDAIERVEILRALRLGEFDILVGINLLREGLDLPEVSLVCILDADKEGYLRSETSLIQTAGRAARHLEGRVVLFADRQTDSIRRLIDISTYRRRTQERHNEKHGITPRGVTRSDQESLQLMMGARSKTTTKVNESLEEVDLLAVIAEIEDEMREAAGKLEYERAALLRDQIKELQKRAGLAKESSTQAPGKGRKKVRYQ